MILVPTVDRRALVEQRVSARQIAFRGSGLFLWARLPSSLDSGELIPLAKARGILLAPGEMFRPDSRPTGHYRFNVAYANDDQLYAFIDSLGR